MSHFITGQKYVPSKICPLEKVSVDNMSVENMSVEKTSRCLFDGMVLLYI